MFLLAAACMILGALSYIFFGSADVQYYNDPDWREKKKTAMSKNTLTVACTLESATIIVSTVLAFSVFRSFRSF